MIEPMIGEVIAAGEVTLEPGIYRLPKSATLVPKSVAKGLPYVARALDDNKGDWPDPPLQAVQQYGMVEIQNFLGGAGIEKKV